MKITKQLIKKFESPEIEVRIINGYFKKAEAVVRYSNGCEYKVCVEHTPKQLAHFGDFNSEEFLYPECIYSWSVHEVPDELKFVSGNLKKIVEYTDDEIDYYVNIMNDAVDEFNKAFYGE